MKTSQGTNKDGEGQPQYPHQMRAGSPPPYPSNIQRQQLPKPEDSHIGNKTLFRATNFFVHAVPHRSVGNTSRLERIRWTSTEKQHILESQTRLLPDTNLINPLLQTEIVISGWLEAFVVLIVLGIGTFIHAWNLYLFPAYQQSEGLLMSNAWAVTPDRLQPYAYTYTQTFFGWVQLAGWLDITGGVTSFGNAINSGRTLMLILGTISGLFVYLIANRLSRSRSAGLLALALFEFSPLAINYQREVSLENIGTFWLLLALYLLVISDSRLPQIVFASIALGLAVLTKEVFIIFFPVMIYAVWLHATAFQRKFALVVFIYITCSVVSIFGMYALLNREPGRLWDGIITGIHAAQQNSNFGLTWQVWTQTELPFLIVSAVAVGLNLFTGWRNPLRAFLALTLISFWAFLLLTNIILTAYLVIFLPLMAMNVAVAINTLLKWPSNRFGFDILRVLLVFGLISVFIPYRVQHAQWLMDQNVTSIQTSTLNWVRSNVPSTVPGATATAPNPTTIVVNSDLYPDLQGGPTAYTGAQIYWNVTLDPGIRYNVLCDRWQYIDYIVLDPQMRNDVRTRPADTLLIDEALHHATLVNTINDNNAPNDPLAAVQIYHVEHPANPPHHDYKDCPKD
jgi:hypothetical protein